MKGIFKGKGLYTIAISTMFLGGFLLLVLFGTASYKRVNSLQEENGFQRTILSYLSVTLKSDRAAEIIVEEKEGVRVLTVAEKEGGFGKRIYLYEGHLVEDYGKLSERLFPKDATVIGEDSRFEISLEDDLLRIETDQGTVLIEVKDRKVSLR